MCILYLFNFLFLSLSLSSFFSGGQQPPRLQGGARLLLPRAEGGGRRGLLPVPAATTHERRAHDRHTGE